MRSESTERAAKRIPIVEQLGRVDAYIGKDVELLPFSRLAEQWAEQHAHKRDGKYVVRLIKWEAERMVVQGKYRKRLSVDPYNSYDNYALWTPL